jgi:hypothetical protein
MSASACMRQLSLSPLANGSGWRAGFPGPSLGRLAIVSLIDDYANPQFPQCVFRELNHHTFHS